MGSFPCKPLPDPWVPECTSPSTYDFVCRKVLSWDKPFAYSPTLARCLDGCGDPGLVLSRRSGGGEGGTSHPHYFTRAWGCSTPVLLHTPYQMLLDVAGKGEVCPNSHCHNREQGHIGAPLAPCHLQFCLAFAFSQLLSPPGSRVLIGIRENCRWTYGSHPQGAPLRGFPLSALAWEEGAGTFVIWSL